MVVFDASVIAIAFDKDATVPLDPETGKLLTYAKERVDALIKALSDSKTQIVIPTPALSEYIVRGGKDKSKRVQIFQTSKVFAIRDFDTLAAVECATLNDPAINSGKRLDDTETFAKLKFDRQIIAIAKAHRATTIYTGDKRLAHVAEQNGIKAVLTWNLALPPENAQIEIALNQADEKESVASEKAAKTEDPKPTTAAEPKQPAATEPPKQPIAAESVKAQPQPAAGATGAAPPLNGSGAKANAVDTASPAAK